jgi:hypothetical protein
MAQKRMLDVFQKNQAYEEFNDDHLYYIVKAAGNVEVRACKRTDIDRVLGMYKYIRTVMSSFTPLTAKWAWPKKYPLVADITGGELTHLFPHNEWERTSYSLGGTACAFISEMSFDELKDWFNFLFWDTSTEYMVKHGLPTREDCKVWERFIWDEKHLSTEQKEYLIEMISEYMDPIPL